MRLYGIVTVEIEVLKLSRSYHLLRLRLSIKTMSKIVTLGYNYFRVLKLRRVSQLSKIETWGHQDLGFEIVETIHWDSFKPDRLNYLREEVFLETIVQLIQLTSINLDKRKYFLFVCLSNFFWCVPIGWLNSSFLFKFR